MPRPSAPRRLRALLVCVAALAAGGASTGCGEGHVPTSAQPVHWSASKPSVLVGSLRAAIVERPGPDRAVIEVQWEGRRHRAHERTDGVADADVCELRLGLPEGAFLIEGEPSRPLATDEDVGTHRWLVQYPLGRTLDAVVRYCAETPEGPRAAELAVRLSED